MDYFNQNYENQQQISGLIVADNGQDLFILTEYRIVENVERIQVTFWDETMVDATYQRHDPSTGLTIVKVDESKLDEETRDGLAVAPLGSSYLVSQGDRSWLSEAGRLQQFDCVRCGDFGYEPRFPRWTMSTIC